jgi:hypothetical protein
MRIMPSFLNIGILNGNGSGNTVVVAGVTAVLANILNVLGL